MKNEDIYKIYKKAIEALYQKTFRRFGNDEKKAIELFEKLLDRDIKSQSDTIKKLCDEVGYDQSASEEIASIYDFISLYKEYKMNGVAHWDIDELIGS